MAYRLIDTAIWSNEKFAMMPMEARLLQIGMLNHADDQGRIKAHPVYLRSLIFPYDDIEAASVATWLAQIEANETIIRYEAGGRMLAQFVNWWDYQKLQWASPSRYEPPPEWTDRIYKGAGRGQTPMSYNWTNKDGTRVPDTCDANGVPLVATNEATNVATTPSQVEPQVQLNLTKPNLTELKSGDTTPPAHTPPRNAEQRRALGNIEAAAQVGMDARQLGEFTDWLLDEVGWLEIVNQESQRGVPMSDKLGKTQLTAITLWGLGFDCEDRWLDLRDWLKASKYEPPYYLANYEQAATAIVKGIKPPTGKKEMPVNRTMANAAALMQEYMESEAQ